MFMNKREDNKEVVSIINPLVQYDPDQPPYIPETFRKTYKRSVYFPERKAVILYQVNEMIKEAVNAGNKMTFNDVVIEAIELWYKQNKRRHLCWLLYRLTGIRNRLAHKVGNLSSKDKNTSRAKELTIHQDKVVKAISQIENFLYLHQAIVSTGDFDTLITEIIQSLKKHSSNEMSRALSKVLERSDIHEIAAQVRHKPKIEEKKTFKRREDEEPEWNE